MPANNPEAAVFCSEKSFTSAELRARISADFPAAGELEHIALTHIDGTEAVSEASLCGITVSGEDMARILSLESSAFTVSEEGDTYIFTVTGSGHLVGMSIAGADAMSQDGCGYRDILAHYYTGTEVKRVVLIILYKTAHQSAKEHQIKELSGAQVCKHSYRKMCKQING